VVKAFAASLLKLTDPTVWAPSTVTGRLAVWAGLEPLAALLNVALAPTPLGILAGFQLAVEFQLPPAARFQVSACVERAWHKSNTAAPFTMSRAGRGREWRREVDGTAKTEGDEAWIWGSVVIVFILGWPEGTKGGIKRLSIPFFTNLLFLLQRKPPRQHRSCSPVLRLLARERWFGWSGNARIQARLRRRA
jgi:hypothetical protein